MLKREFLRDPIRNSPDDIPLDWLREGWSNQSFRDDVIYMLARSLSKTGGFHLVGDAWLRALPEVLTLHEAADLYNRLRDESQRFEYEWRETFINLFRIASNDLPPSHDAAILLEELEYVIVSGDGRNLDALLPLAVTMPEVYARLPAIAENARSKGYTVIADLITESHAKRR